MALFRLLEKGAVSGLRARADGTIEMVERALGREVETAPKSTGYFDRLRSVAGDERWFFTAEEADEAAARALRALEDEGERWFGTQTYEGSWSGTGLSMSGCPTPGKDQIRPHLAESGRSSTALPVSIASTRARRASERDARSNSCA